MYAPATDPNRQTVIALHLIAIALVVAALAVTLLGCGAYGSKPMAYDPGPAGAGHWRPLHEMGEGTDIHAEWQADIDLVKSGVLPTFRGRVQRLGMCLPSGALGGMAPGEINGTFDAWVLPSGRVATGCKVSDLTLEYRDVVHNGRRLILDPVCLHYDAKANVVLWRVERNKAAQ